MNFETCLVFMFCVDYGFTNNKQILHKASTFFHARVDESIKNMKSFYFIRNEI